jgi:hypothetical protein
LKGVYPGVETSVEPDEVDIFGDGVDSLRRVRRVRRVDWWFQEKMRFTDRCVA